MLALWSPNVTLKLIILLIQVRDMYRLKDAYLREQLDLQLFNREAERIDAATKGHEAFLDFKVWIVFFFCCSIFVLLFSFLCNHRLISGSWRLGRIGGESPEETP